MEYLIWEKLHLRKQFAQQQNTYVQDLNFKPQINSDIRD